MTRQESGSRGGQSAWIKLTPEQRSAVMSKRNRKRWRKHRKAVRDARRLDAQPPVHPQEPTE